MYRLTTFSLVASPTVPMYLPTLQKAPPHNSFFLSVGNVSNILHRRHAWMSAAENVNMILIKAYFIDHYFVSFGNPLHGFLDTFFEFIIQQGFTVFNSGDHMVADFVRTV